MSLPRGLLPVTSSLGVLTKTTSTDSFLSKGAAACLRETPATEHPLWLHVALPFGTLCFITVQQSVFKVLKQKSYLQEPDPDSSDSNWSHPHPLLTDKLKRSRDLVSEGGGCKSVVENV